MSREPEGPTYGSYLRVPELLSLQTPLTQPPVQGEMLFIILQQAQELWFRQILHDLRAAIEHLQSGRPAAATRLIGRVCRVLRVMGDELEVMETLAPAEFQQFRPALGTASGFQSAQFRELELVSGLEDEAFLRLAARVVDVDDVRRRWPTSLREAFEASLRVVDDDVEEALRRVYVDPDRYSDIYNLAEGLTDYELAFGAWRFRHIRLVERVIGDRAAGTGGSAGSGYLRKTLEYRFFPELQHVRNELSRPQDDDGYLKDESPV